MRFWLVGSIFVMSLTSPVWAQEKLCSVENANLYLVKQARDAAEKQSAKLAVQLERLFKEKQAWEKEKKELESKLGEKKGSE